MEVEELKDAEEAAQRCAAVLAAEIGAGARDVALTGGTTPTRAYELLGPMVASWEGVSLWYGDERCVPPDHPECNHRAASAHLRAPGALWHPMPGELGPDRGAARYGAEIAGTTLDVTLLGMGPDGHVASLFPDHAALAAGGSTVGIHDAPKPPPERISLTLGKLNESRRIVLLVTGEAKREALRRVIDPDGRADRHVPATLLARDRLLVLADAAAVG
ncbi:MAG: 6-phosphogluconolactonase [Solirubrobacteraceae bacterium]|jgi:6-phosphogluconolactonase|nr:6-phosphogluconolactonase [Solirubrobacteraceae bacterium]